MQKIDFKKYDINGDKAHRIFPRYYRQFKRWANAEGNMLRPKVKKEELHGFIKGLFFGKGYFYGWSCAAADFLTPIILKEKPKWLE